MRYTLTLTLDVAAASASEAHELGLAACEHLSDTFNDDGSISPLVRVEARPAAIAADLADMVQRTEAAEATGDAEALATIWLQLQGLEWVDSIDEAAADMTPAPVAAALIRERLQELRAA